MSWKRNALLTRKLTGDDCVFQSSGFEDRDSGMVKTAKTDKAISFWDETGKHEDMQTHLDMDILDMPGMQESQAAQEEEELREAEHVYKEALGGLLDLHRGLLHSLPKSRNVSQLGSRNSARTNKQRSLSKKPRSRSLLPTLTSLDAMQHVYSDIKGLGRKSHSYNCLRAEVVSSFSGWETDDALLADHLPALRHQSLSSSKKMRSKARECMDVEAKTLIEADGRAGTPTLSTQLLDFDGCQSATCHTSKSKIRDKRFALPLTQRMPSPQETQHLEINFRMEKSGLPPRSPSVATQGSASASEVVGWSPYACQ